MNNNGKVSYGLKDLGQLLGRTGSSNMVKPESQRFQQKSSLIDSINRNMSILGFNDQSECNMFFFWGAAQEKKGVIDKGCLSQHYIRKFVMRGNTFNCGEQAMMYHKAMLFDDVAIAKKIMNERYPPKMKTLGRGVINFNQRIWDNYKYNLVLEINRAKFSQNADLRKFLLSFPDNTLFVEASPFDGIWGVRLPEYAAEIRNIHHWQGENLLGFILTTVRREIKNGSTGNNKDPLLVTSSKSLADM